MSEEVHVRFCEGLGVRIPWFTRLPILCRSKRAAERTLASTTKFLEQKLFLKVNREKTEVTYIRHVKFLGYSFYVFQGEAKLRVHPKSVQKLKDTIR